MQISSRRLEGERDSVKGLGVDFCDPYRTLGYRRDGYRRDEICKLGVEFAARGGAKWGRRAEKAAGSLGTGWAWEEAAGAGAAGPTMQLAG